MTWLEWWHGKLCTYTCAFMVCKLYLNFKKYKMILRPQTLQDPDLTHIFPKCYYLFFFSESIEWIRPLPWSVDSEEINPNCPNFTFFKGEYKSYNGIWISHHMGLAILSLAYLLLTAQGYNSDRTQLQKSSLFVYVESIAIHDALKD